MKRIAMILLCAALLCGCTPGASPETQPAPTPAATQAPTAPAETRPAETDPPQTLPAETVPAKSFPYTFRLHAAVQIFDGPGYDACFVGSVGEDGVYTIMEEASDADGHRWGRLKSGIGWVDLDAVEIRTPVTVAYTDEDLTDSPLHTFIAEESPYLTGLIFHAAQPVTDVRLALLEPNPENWNSYLIDTPLYSFPELMPGDPFAAGVVFYGDMTAYGLSFTDQAGVPRHFAVTFSGRNGAPILNEYYP